VLCTPPVKSRRGGLCRLCGSCGLGSRRLRGRARRGLGPCLLERYISCVREMGGRKHAANYLVNCPASSDARLIVDNLGGPIGGSAPERTRYACNVCRIFFNSSVRVLPGSCGASVSFNSRRDRGVNLLGTHVPSQQMISLFISPFFVVQMNFSAGGRPGETSRF
jgi:hypothetical protein